MWPEVWKSFRTPAVFFSNYIGKKKNEKEREEKEGEEKRGEKERKLRKENPLFFLLF
jgi:hypothetical protein